MTKRPSRFAPPSRVTATRLFPRAGKVRRGIRGTYGLGYHATSIRSQISPLRPSASGRNDKAGCAPTDRGSEGTCAGVPWPRVRGHACRPWVRARLRERKHAALATICYEGVTLNKASGDARPARRAATALRRSCVPARLLPSDRSVGWQPPAQLGDGLTRDRTLPATEAHPSPRPAALRLPPAKIISIQGP
jgi:hypothetical protein